MSRQSGNELDPVTGYLRNGYDYLNQAWVLDGKYVRCGHSKYVLCWWYGRQHAGEQCTTDGGVRRFV